MSNDTKVEKDATKLAKIKADARFDLGVTLTGSASTGQQRKRGSFLHECHGL